MSELSVEDWARDCGVFENHRFFRTSGSSGGEVKWIALSEEALAWSARTVIEGLGIIDDDVLGLAIPEVHVGGAGLVLRAEISGARLARFLPKWEVREFAKWCAEEEVTVLSLVPTQVHDLVEGLAVGNPELRVVVVGGGALDDVLATKARALGWPVVPSYGMTETASQVAVGEGLPLYAGWEARVVDGCLSLKGGSLLSAVIRREGESYVAHDPKSDGWFLTQDRVEIVEGGLRILGRDDRRVKVLGVLVDLDELEQFWATELGVDCALVAQPDDRRGVILFLFCVGSVAQVESINARLPGPERVQVWKSLECLPRSPLGKVDRSVLMKFSVAT